MFEFMVKVLYAVLYRPDSVCSRVSRCCMLLSSIIMMYALVFLPAIACFSVPCRFCRLHRIKELFSFR